MKSKIAFTLAEVLITLTILGVVAAIAVPSLQKQNYRRTQVSRLAKAYASLENAAANIATNTNCIGRDLECTGLLNITNSKDFQDKFAELANFRVSKKYSGNYFNPKPLVYETDKTKTTSELYSVFVTTPDNIAYSASPVNMQYVDKNGKTQYKKAIRVVVFTDKGDLYNSEGKLINWQIGMGSNDVIIGRSAFMFIIYDNFKVEPATITWDGKCRPNSTYDGCKQARTACNPKTATSWAANGFDCTARIICDGWKMKY